MCVIVLGDLWKSKADTILFTGNSSINFAGELVMGRGAALQAKQMFGPKFCKALGQKIAQVKGGEYNLLITSATPYAQTTTEAKWLGVLQVKYGYSDPADLGLIQRSLSVLAKYANHEKAAGRTVAVNFPGIGAGQLAEMEPQIMEMLKVLPDNVYVHKYNVGTLEGIKGWKSRVPK